MARSEDDQPRANNIFTTNKHTHTHPIYKPIFTIDQYTRFWPLKLVAIAFSPFPPLVNDQPSSLSNSLSQDFCTFTKCVYVCAFRKENQFCKFHKIRFYLLFDRWFARPTPIPTTVCITVNNIHLCAERPAALELVFPFISPFNLFFVTFFNALLELDQCSIRCCDFFFEHT